MPLELLFELHSMIGFSEIAVSDVSGLPFGSSEIPKV
jgi:hypothetical protein